MNNFKLEFLALSRSIEMDISCNDDAPIVGDLLMAFDYDADFKNLNIKINALQHNTNELKRRINSVVERYKNLNCKIQQLNTYLQGLKKNEPFFVLPGGEITTEQRNSLTLYLHSIKEKKDFTQMTKEVNNLFGVLMDNYEIFAFNENTRKKIGEREKQKRVCRYCDKQSPEVSFKKVAHSISEALGNKTIITNDECDTCNEKFGQGIETDLINYLNFFRVFFGVRGKSGVPKLKGKNFEITNNEVIEIIQRLSDKELKDSISNNFEFRLETKQNVTKQNIYKALVKYAISVIDRRYIVNFKKTIAWINGVETIDTLPKVALLTSYDMFTEHPQLIVYLRKNEETKLPYVVAEFKFTCLTFVYIIPGSSKDSTDFTNEDNYKYFWNFFKHYNSVHNWSFLKLNDNVPRKFVMNIDFNKKK